MYMKNSCLFYLTEVSFTKFLIQRDFKPPETVLFKLIRFTLINEGSLLAFYEIFEIRTVVLRKANLFQNRAKEIVADHNLEGWIYSPSSACLCF